MAAWDLEPDTNLIIDYEKFSRSFCVIWFWSFNVSGKVMVEIVSSALVCSLNVTMLPVPLEGL